MAVSTRSFSLANSLPHLQGFNRYRSPNVYPCVYRPNSSVPQVAENSAWLVLQTPSTSVEEVSILRQKVKYLAVLPNMEGAVVLVDDGRGLLQPQSAFYVAENVIFVFDGSLLQSSKSVKMVLYRNPMWIFTSSGEGIKFSTVDIASFLFVGENLVLQKILECDPCYTVVDRFMLAMAFIYLKRANMSDYVFTNIVAILAALLLANKMEEDEGAGRSLLQVIYCCLPQGASATEKLKFISAIVNFQSTLFQKMLYRGYVDAEECEEVISVAPNHPFWKRWRLSFHGGAVRQSHQSWKLQFIRASTAAVFPSVILNPSGAPQKCIMCQGNANYSTTVQERFGSRSSLDAQKVHLKHVLSAVSDVHHLNLKLSMSYVEVALHFQQPSSSCFTVMDTDRRWPLEYLHLLEVENEIEGVLADEKYLQKFVAMIQKRKNLMLLDTPV